LRDAVVGFELRSPETAVIDRWARRSEYADLPGPRRCVLAEPWHRAAIVLEQTGDDWHEIAVVAGMIAVPERGIDLALEDICRGVRSLPA